MNIYKITDEVFVDKDEVASVEREIVKRWISTSPSGGSGYHETFDGSRIILKNGRKVYIDGIMPEKIINILCFEVRT